MLDLFRRNINQSEAISPLFHDPQLAILKAHHVKRRLQLVIGRKGPDKLALTVVGDQTAAAGINHVVTLTLFIKRDGGRHVQAVACLIDLQA